MPPTSPKSVVTPTRIVSLVASGRATTRSALSRSLGWAPSTVSTQLRPPIEDGVIGEEDIRDGERGRPTRRLSLVRDGSFVVIIDMNVQHARLGIINTANEIEARTEMPIDVADGPEAVVAAVSQRVDTLLGGTRLGRTLRAVGIAVPGPVDWRTGKLTLPARMPGWGGFSLRGWLEQRLEVPVVVENDANVMAFAEHFARDGGNAPTVTIKAGTGISGGVIMDGEIYRGATSAAGDITHVRMPSAGDLPCSCGNRGCLETVASGAALVAALRARGLDVSSTTELVELALAGDPDVTTAVRAAGAMLGQMLCSVANFFNPQAIYLGGSLAVAEPFVAAVRSQIYQGSHPLATSALTIEPAQTGEDGVLLSLARMAVTASLQAA